VATLTGAPEISKPTLPPERNISNRRQRDRIIIGANREATLNEKQGACHLAAARDCQKNKMSDRGVKTKKGCARQRDDQGRAGSMIATRTIAFGGVDRRFQAPPPPGF
jgi:hypothetical protein